MFHVQVKNCFVTGMMSDVTPCKIYSLILLKKPPDTWICKLGVLARNHKGKNDGTFSCYLSLWFSGRNSSFKIQLG